MVSRKHPLTGRLTMLSNVAPEIAADRSPKGGGLPLHAAAKLAPVVVVETLLKVHPAGAKAVDDEGSLPLHVAAASGSAESAVQRVVALLAAHGEGRCALDSEGKLPLHRAAARQAPIEVVAALLDAHPEG